MNEANWAGNHRYRAARIHQPASMDDLRRICATAPNLHALGTRHGFNDIADAGELVSLERMEARVEIDAASGEATCAAGMRYAEVAKALDAAGWALHNLGSLPHISVAGATATATHGSGDRLRNLSSAVAGLELVTSDGEVVSVRRGDPDFDGMVVGLGALGVVSRVTLDIQPTYLVRQVIYRHLPWDAVERSFDVLMAAGDSVSLFTDYGTDVDEVWVKQRVPDLDTPPLPGELLGAVASDRPMHPVSTLTADGCTPQMGVPGPWWTRLPHFRPDAVPASGDEIQTEYMVPRHHAVAAIGALRALEPTMRPLLLIAEVRTVAGDDLWLSTAYGGDIVCLHFSWRNDAAAVERMLVEVEAALAPFGPRPHWSKVFTLSPDAIASRYERLPDFLRLRDRLDPRGAFRNAWLDRVLPA